MTTALSVAARNLVVQSPELTALGLLGPPTGMSDTVWPIWVFADDPQRRIENTQVCAIVFTEGSAWTGPNDHNTEEFPALVMDIWADPTRNSDKSVKRYDADDKIKRVATVINRVLHNVNNAVPTDAPTWLGTPGMPRVWGTAEEIETRTGLIIISSKRNSGPDFSDMLNNDGGRMGRYTFDVIT